MTGIEWEVSRRPRFAGLEEKPDFSLMLKGGTLDQEGFGKLFVGERAIVAPEHEH